MSNLDYFKSLYGDKFKFNQDFEKDFKNYFNDKSLFQIGPNNWVIIYNDFVYSIESIFHNNEITLKGTFAKKVS